jgi:hypothetical protein
VIVFGIAYFKKNCKNYGILAKSWKRIPVLCELYRIIMLCKPIPQKLPVIRYF